jgi:hypothetical protein
MKRTSITILWKQYQNLPMMNHENKIWYFQILMISTIKGILHGWPGAAMIRKFNFDCSRQVRHFSWLSFMHCVISARTFFMNFDIPGLSKKKMPLHNLWYYEGGQRTGEPGAELGQSISGDFLLRHVGEDTQNLGSAKRYPMVGMGLCARHGPGVVP